MSRVKKYLIGVAAFIVIVGGVYYFEVSHSATPNVVYKTPEEKDPYVRFDMEVYDKIVENYWAKVTDDGLANHFQLSVQKALSSPVVPFLGTADRAGVAKMVSSALSTASSTEDRRNLAVQIASVVLYNLPPVGHGELLSQKQEIALRQGVSNINPSNDLYQNLGVAKDATVQDINDAYKAKVAELKNATSSEAKNELAQALHAKEVLSNPNSKDLYDAAKIEPTLSSRVMGKTLYLDMSKVSPTSFWEFGRAILAASTTPGLNSLVLDLRGNLGGALDFAQNFLGLFIGNNQYAFDLFHQGDYNVQRTVQGKFDELNRYKEIAVLTDGMSQSTAEVTTAAMKRFHLATVVGETTRGWGTVENTFPITTEIDPSQKYSILLVHSITLREDNQPIEGRGVDPDVNVKDPHWKEELSKYFKTSSIISAIETIFSSTRTK